MRLRDAGVNNDEIVIPEFIKLGIEPQDVTTMQRLVVSKPPSVANGAILYRHELYQLRPRDAGGAGRRRDATSGKVYLPQEKALSAGTLTISMK